MIVKQDWEWKPLKEIWTNVKNEPQLLRKKKSRTGDTIIPKHLLVLRQLKYLYR